MKGKLLLYLEGFWVLKRRQGCHTVYFTVVALLKLFQYNKMYMYDLVPAIGCYCGPLPPVNGLPTTI